MKKLALIIVSLFLLVSFVAAASPVITPINDQTTTVGDAYSYQVEATDADNDTLTYSLTQSPAGMSISSSGLISWTPATSGNEAITVSVSDGVNAPTEGYILTAKNDLPELTLSLSSLEFGGEDAERGNTFVQTVTITNTGTQVINALSASLTSTSGAALSSDFNGIVTVNKPSLNVGESAVATVSLTIPFDQDSRSTTIGRVSVSGTGDSASVSDTSNLIMEAKSYLRIKDVDIDVEGDDESIDDGDTYDKIKEDDEVVVTVRIENLYSNNDNVEIENVYFEIESDDDDWDIDEESDEDDIKEDDDQDFEVTFRVGDDIDDDETDVTIRVFGDDAEENFEHYDELTFTFEIDRERDEVSIISADFTKNSYTCNDNFATLEVRIKNTGTDDQDDVTLFVSSDELDYNQRIREIELDEGDTETEDFRIPLDVDRTDEFFVDIETFVDGDEESDSETAVISVSCASSSSSSSSSGSTTTRPTTPVQPNTDDTVVIVTPPTNTGNTGVNTGASNAGKVVYGEPVGAFGDVRGSDLYVVLLIALIVLVLIGIFLLGGRLLNKN